MSQPSVRPPRFTRSLLLLAAPPSSCRDVVGDHDAEFARLVAEHGTARARRAYRRHVGRSLAPLLGARVRHLGRGLSAPGWRDDIGHATRWLVRHPRTAAVCIATLGIAMAATLAATSIFERAVLRPLPFPEPEQIVRLWNTGPDMPPGVRSSGLVDVDDWRTASRTMAAISAYTPHTATLTGRAEPRRIDGMRVGRDFDLVLGVRALHGRMFAPNEFVTGGPDVVVLTHGFWTREFGGDPAAIGQSLVLDDKPHRIVGVLEALPIVYPTAKHDFWMPLAPRQGAFWEFARETGWVDAIGRLGPATTLADARQELSGIARGLAAQYPASNGRRAGIELDRVVDAMSETLRPVLGLLAAAIACVLVVAIGNLITLLLAHGERRRREFAVRLALGAGEARLRRQIGLESLALAAVAGGVAVGSAPLMVRAFRSLYPTELPGDGAMWLTATPVLVAAGAVAVSTMLLTWPQHRFTRAAAKAGALSASHRVTGTQRRTRGFLIAAQSALSVMLLALSFVFVRTFNGLASTSPGFNPEGVLVFSVTPSPARFGSAEAVGQFFDEVLDGIRRLPGVNSAASAIGVPFVSYGWAFGVPRPGVTGPPVLVGVNAVSAQYLETLRLPLISGRMLTDDEQRGTSAVLINEAAAKLLPDPGPAVGQRVTYSKRQWEVVGVIGDVREGRLDREGRPWLVMPWKQAGKRPQTMIVRTTGDPLAMVASIAAVVHRVDPTAPLAGLSRLSDIVDESVAAQRFRAIVVSGLSAIAALLAAIGVYSVTAFAVARQERENGVRLALGESTRALWRRVILAAVTPAAIGAVLGVGAAWMGARWVQSLLFQVDARDPLTLASAATALVAIAAIAALPPARRAARVDPAITLRAD